MTRVPCPACEHTNVDANFCDRCGTALTPRVLCGGCSKLVVGGGVCKSCGAPSVLTGEQHDGWIGRLPSWLRPTRDWPVLLRRMGVGMLALAAALAVGRTLAEGATWTGGSLGRIALLAVSGVLLTTLRGGRIPGLVAVLPLVIAKLVGLSRAFTWIGAFELVALAGVIVVLLQPGARASLDRARSQPMGPMPEWIEDLGHLAAVALWVGPLNLLWSLLSG